MTCRESLRPPAKTFPRKVFFKAQNRQASAMRIFLTLALLAFLGAVGQAKTLPLHKLNRAAQLERLTDDLKMVAVYRVGLSNATTLALIKSQGNDRAADCGWHRRLACPNSASRRIANVGRNKFSVVAGNVLRFRRSPPSLVATPVSGGTPETTGQRPVPPST